MMVIQKRHEFLLRGLRAVVRAQTLHSARVALCTDVRQKTTENSWEVKLLLKEIRPRQPRVVVDNHH